MIVIIVCAGMIDGPAGTFTCVTWVMAIVRNTAIRVTVGVSARTTSAFAATLQNNTREGYDKDERCNFD